MQESESEEDILDEGDDDAEEDHEDPEPEHSVNPEPEVKKHNEVSAAPKEAERQLSKKERKKKELAELDALLADLGVTQKESNGQDGSQGNYVHVVCRTIYHIIFKVIVCYMFYELRLSIDHGMAFFFIPFLDFQIFQFCLKIYPHFPLLFAIICFLFN